ncbi:MAG: hypothetical protein K2G88_01815, partial [Oscillospiraceae bacterium]|nr:hypothetical protein [Oscillospiraceae bacterium]
MKKKIFISTLTALALLSAPITIHANAISGDVNLDSVLDANDAYAILEHSASIGAGNDGTISDKALILADYNSDGQIDAKDAFEILNYCFEQLIPNKSRELATILDELATIDKWEDEWKRAYSIQLTKFQSYENRYELADITGDFIPELFIIFYENTEDTPKTIVYTYQNGSCQQIHFPTESGAVDTWDMYVSSEFDALFVHHSQRSIADTGFYDYDIDTIYEIDENLQAIPKHELIWDHANDSYYFDDTAITKKEYDNYRKFAYWFD